MSISLTCGVIAAGSLGPEPRKLVSEIADDDAAALDVAAAVG